MKRSLIFILLVLLLPAVSAIAQPALPFFLDGIWKMENREIYEQWEMLNDSSLKGTSYRMNNGEKAVTEYLEIRRQENLIIYTATVLNQNEGKGIDFILQQPDSLTWSFENPEHDFPKKIVYQKRSDTEIYVQVSDDGERAFAYVMKKIPDAKPNTLNSFFKDLRGVWVATPHDSSFVSRLEYKKGNDRFLLSVKNTLSSKTGKLFAEYEGVYVYNPIEENITFTTVTKNEIHIGSCEVKGDTLIHKARIEGNSSIKSYTSAIVKMKDGTLNYYADYSETDTIPELSFQNPLIYRKKQP